MMQKRILPEGFNFDVPSVEIIDTYSKGLNKTAMLKRASAFDDVIADIKPKKNRTYLHVITTGALETYGPNRNCFMAGTPVITKRGVCPIEQVHEGDEVLTVDGTFQPVLRTMCRSYKGEMVAIKICGIAEPVHMTADHPVLAIDSRFMSSHYDKARKGRESYEDYMSALHEARFSAQTFKTATTVKRDDSVVVPFIHACTTFSSVLNVLPKHRHTKPCAVQMNDALYAYVAGLWLAEGCIAARYTDSEKTKLRRADVVYTLNKEKDKKAIDAVHEFAARAGIGVEVQDHGKAANHILHSTELAEQFVALMGRGAHNKFIHMSVFGAPREWQLNFIAGYVDGDGCSIKTGKEKGSLKCSSVSLSLVTGLQNLLFSLGVKSSVCKAYNRMKNGCFGHADNPIYQLSIASSQASGLLAYSRNGYVTGYTSTVNVAKNLLCRDAAYMKITDVSRYSQDVPILVYNLEVAGSHTYCVPFVVHNCDGWPEGPMHVVFPDPEDPKHTEETTGEGLKKYHDSTYMKDGAVYQEHKTKDTDPSGEIVAAKYNDDMHRGCHL